MGLRAFGAIGDMGHSMCWSLGQTGLRTVRTKGPFEALGHMVYMGFSTFGVPVLVQIGPGGIILVVSILPSTAI